MTENECDCPVCRWRRGEKNFEDPTAITVSMPNDWFASFPAGKPRRNAKSDVSSCVRFYYPNATVTFTRRKSWDIHSECLADEVESLRSWLGKGTWRLTQKNMACEAISRSESFDARLGPL